MQTKVMDPSLRWTGKAREEHKGNTRLGKLFKRNGVQRSGEMDRILSIPSVSPDDYADLVESLSDMLRLPGSGATLKLIQAAALCAIHDYEGAFCVIRVGGGKTWISWLAGVVLESERTLVLIPAKLREKTERDFRHAATIWQSPKQIEIMHYELLSRDRGVDELEAYQPDLIVADEAHKLKNKRAACTRRLLRYLSKHPECRYVDMSGTSWKRSIMECHHRLLAALPEEIVPLPRKWMEARTWADALDEKVQNRLAPGALLALCDDSELDTIARDQTQALECVRQAFGRRLMSTPGVIGTTGGGECDASILIELEKITVPPSVDQAFARLRAFWETPDGRPCASPADVWRIAKELSLGFFYQWDPAPPGDWMEARREWAAFVRERLKHSRTYDTEGQISLACKRGEFKSREWEKWAAIKDTFTPNTVPVWLDDFAIRAASKWLAKEKQLCWVEFGAFGDKLSRETGIPYFRQGGMCGKISIEEHKGPAILGVRSNCEGRNLQDRYSKNLLTSIVDGGDTWEQLIGRTHREGQEADCIESKAWVSCFESVSAWQQVLRDAKMQESISGQEQKVLIADIVGQKALEELPRTAAWDKSSTAYFEEGEEDKG